MTRLSDRMEEALVAEFSPSVLSIIDDSAKHAGHVGARAGGESHFRVLIVSAAFVGKSQVARHRMVYAVLKPMFDAGLHALQIDAKTQQEDGA